MKLLDVICEELGIETSRDWLGNDGRRYRILENGYLMVKNESYGWLESDITKVIRGEIKPMWKPVQGEWCCFVDFAADDLYGVISRWGDSYANSEWEDMLLERGLVFKTEEEAIECAKRMLEVIK